MYLLEIMRQTACLVSFNSVMVEGYAVLFSCTTVVTGVNQKVLPVLSKEALLHIWLSTEYYGFRPSSPAVDTVS